MNCRIEFFGRNVGTRWVVTANPTRFLAFSKALDRLFSGRIENSEYVGAAAQILAIEARHASYVRLLNEEVPFPNAFEPTLTMDEVTEAVDPFIQD